MSKELVMPGIELAEQHAQGVLMGDEYFKKVEEIVLLELENKTSLSKRMERLLMEFRELPG